MPNDDGSLTLEELFGTWFNVYRLGMAQIDVTVPDMPQVSEEILYGLGKALKETQSAMQEAEGTRWEILAANAEFAFQRGVRDIMGLHSPTVLPWDAHPPRYQLVWQALVRHLLNALMFDAREDGLLTTHEQDMIDVWLRPKLEELGLTQRAADIRKEERQCTPNTEERPCTP